MITKKENEYLEEFFLSLIQDTDEQALLRLVLADKNPDEIIESILNGREKSEKKGGSA